MNVQVLPISTDSPYVHKAWLEHELSDMVESDFPFPLLSDQNGQIGTLYGVYDEHVGVNLRGRFIINPEGHILAMEVLMADVGRDVDELIRQLEAFQYARESGEVTPAGWHRGEVALKPGTDLVGRVKDNWQQE